MHLHNLQSVVVASIALASSLAGQGALIAPFMTLAAYPNRVDALPDGAYDGAGTCPLVFDGLVAMLPVGSVFNVGVQAGSDIYPDSASNGAQHLVVWTNSSNSVLGQFTTATGTVKPAIGPCREDRL